jgi:predicted dehydrogenase
MSSRNETQQVLDTQLKSKRDLGEPHARECMEFAEAIIEGRPSPVPPEESLHVTAILDGLYRSAEERREVKLDY